LPFRIKSRLYGLALVILVKGLCAQDSLVVSPDSGRTALWPNLVKSAIVPGLGQIGQERPVPALLYFASGVAMMYGMSYNYFKYEKYEEEEYRKRFYLFAGLYGSVWLINMGDILYAHYRLKPRKWESDMFSDTPLKSPWGAVARSAMLPGWGQWYNESYLKSVISFSLCAIFARKVYIHHQRYRQDPGPVERDRRSANAWYLSITYVVTLMDAFVDAYLYRFNETMELTLMVTPIEEGMVIGARISF
jgi:hypothetical protein